MVLRDELAHNFFAESLSTKPENGLQWNSSNSQEVQRALLLAMEGKYSKNLQTSLRTTGLGLDHHWIARGRFNILVSLSSDLYLACMQVPNITRLFQDDVRSKHLVNGFDDQKHDNASLSKLTKLSHLGNTRFMSTNLVEQEIYSVSCSETIQQETRFS
ncbi:hypothetical protein ACS0TY_035404 [Phlomoides rotata]